MFISTDTNDDTGGEDEEYDIEEVYDEPSTTTKATTTMATTTITTKKPTEKTTMQPTFHTTIKPTYYHTTVQSSYNFHNPSSDTQDEVYDLIDDNEDSTTPIKNTTSPNFPNYSSDSQLQRPSSVADSHKPNFPHYDLSSNVGDEKATDLEDHPHVYDPHELVFQHNNLGRKTPAVSFQQQSFSSDGQNSHVTVTTHTGGGTFNQGSTKNHNKNIEHHQPSRTYLSSSSTPNSPDTKAYKDKSHSFSNFPAFNTPKRTPLLPTPVAQGQLPTGHPGKPSTPKQQHPDEPLYFSFRKPILTPQGFKSKSPNSNVNLSAKPNVKNPPKPFQSYQPSERHEVSIESEFEFEKLTPTFPFIHQDFSNYHFEHKRSQDADKYEPSDVPDKSVETTTVTSTPYYNTWATRNNNYTKSLPRVIVTASASVSDSNGKKLNYTVGSLVHAVHPLVPTNYDNYKESDVLLDPFFLDVPKLQKPRGKRYSRANHTNLFIRIRKRNIFGNLSKLDRVTTTKPSTDLDIPLKVEESATQPSHNIDINYEKTDEQRTEYVFTVEPLQVTSSSNIVKESKTSHWVPPDYVNDNYEPLTYSEIPPSDADKSDKKSESTNESYLKKQSLEKYLEQLHVSTISNLMPESFTKSSFKASIIDKNQPYSTESDVRKHFDLLKLTTENSIAKTTLDVANLETTTVSFIESVFNKSKASKEPNNYQIKSVHLVTFSDKSSGNMNFSCNGKKYFKFYPDKTDCRTFHICSPGLSSQQVLDIVFICDLGTYFNHNSVRCFPDKPNDCELFSIL